MAKISKVNIDGKVYLSKDDLIDAMVEFCVGYEALEDGNERVATDYREEIGTIEDFLRKVLDDQEMHFEWKKRYLKKRYGALLPKTGLL